MRYFIKQNIIELLQSNMLLRTELALVLGVGERAIYNTVIRYQKHPHANSSLTKIAAIRFFELKGFSEDEVIILEKPAV